MGFISTGTMQQDPWTPGGPPVAPPVVPTVPSMEPVVPSQGDLNPPPVPAEAPDEAEEPRPATYVYALGRIEPRFPSIGVEREFAQATGRAATTGLTDHEALRAVLAEQQNRYLVRQLCWVLTIEGLETYLLSPRDPLDFELLIEALRPNPKFGDLDLVIGILGPIAPPEACNGLTLPVVFFDQIYSFDRESIVNAIPRPDTVPEDQETRFRAAADETFGRLIRMVDNVGATNEDRALNYLAVRYDAVYATAADAIGRNMSIAAVEARPSTLSGIRSIMDVIFTLVHRETGVEEKHLVRVDVTEEFPFLVTRLSPYFDR
jgi:hypothetical protein